MSLYFRVMIGLIAAVLLVAGFMPIVSPTFTEHSGVVEAKYIDTGFAGLFKGYHIAVKETDTSDVYDLSIEAAVYYTIDVGDPYTWRTADPATYSSFLMVVIGVVLGLYVLISRPLSF